MKSSPRISVVTCAVGGLVRSARSAALVLTVESVRSQGYPNFEHLLVLGPEGLNEAVPHYAHLRAVAAPLVRAEALTRGLASATGDILCRLEPGDVVLPGAFARVAHELDPKRGRHVVQGRCRFVDACGDYLGVEHPGVGARHQQVLSVWQGHGLPSPALFWSAEAWRRCGPLGPVCDLAADYDLLCKVTREHRLCSIEQPLVASRLGSRAESEPDWLAEALRVSRQYWGPWTSPRYWRLLGRYLSHRLQRQHLAADWLSRARQARRARRPLRATAWAALAGLLGPEVLLDHCVLYRWRERGKRGGQRATDQGPPRGLLGVLPPLRWLRRSGPAVRPETLFWRDFVGLHTDGWAGPLLVLPLDVRPWHTHLFIRGQSPKIQRDALFEVSVAIDRESRASQSVNYGDAFELTLPLEGLRPGEHECQIASTDVVMHDYLNNEDYRPLSFYLERFTLEGQPVPEVRARAA
jgi:hypothetical protein